MYTSDLVKFWVELYTILLILGEIWSKGSNLTSLRLVDIFTEINAEALNIKSYQPRQKHGRGSAEAKCIFILLPRHFICRAKNAEIRGLWLDAIRLDFSCETQIILIEMVYIKINKIHTHTKQLENDNTGKG